VDKVTLPDGRVFRVSIVDAANPIAFMLATDLGLTGTEAPIELERRTDATAILEEVRAIVAEMIGIVPSRGDALRVSPGLPKVGMVAPPADYRTLSDAPIAADGMDLQGRLMSMQTAHRSYMTTGAICTAAAAMIPGTLVHEVTRGADARPRRDVIRIANPYGIFDTTVSHDEASGVIHGVKVGRTARHILDGVIHVRESETGDRD
jgi:2-methylaconitate cis-trans-isomerase PrpF